MLMALYFAVTWDVDEVTRINRNIIIAAHYSHVPLAIITLTTALYELDTVYTPQLYTYQLYRTYGSSCVAFNPQAEWLLEGM